MSGDIGEPKEETKKVTLEVMKIFSVSEDTANRIIAWSNHNALQKLAKWRNNVIARLHTQEIERLREIRKA